MGTFPSSSGHLTILQEGKKRKKKKKGEKRRGSRDVVGLAVDRIGCLVQKAEEKKRNGGDQEEREVRRKPPQQNSTKNLRLPRGGWTRKKKGEGRKGKGEKEKRTDGADLVPEFLLL